MTLVGFLQIVYNGALKENPCSAWSRWARLRPLHQRERSLGYKTLVRIDIRSAGFISQPFLMMSLGPRQPRLDSGSPQQDGFPCQMLLQGFWAATHLPFVVRLRCPLSSFGSRRRLIKLTCGNCHGRLSNFSKIERS